MFDPETIGLIRQAPPLEGLDLDALPQILTDAFATVVAARIRLRAGALDPSNAEVEQTLALLAKLADAQEAYVALLPDRENRAAAAFVAASAHQARRLAWVGVQAPTCITASFVSSEVSAALLFMIAEAYPDAAEAAKRIAPAPDRASPTERALLAGLKMLAEGRLYDILDAPDPEMLADAPAAERALEALLGLLLNGVQALARRLTRPGAAADDAPSDLFRRVKALCIDELPDPFGDGRSAFSIYSGPLHLANLLLAVNRDLSDAAIALLPAPDGIDAKAWAAVLRPMSRARPFLWRNHRAAIAQGFLDPGLSSAMSFPTGGGKSTLAELKIATALLRDQQVVFLAPTHALVGQTVKALQRTFRGVSVLGDVDEDINLTIVELPEVVVTTPERCLMLLSMQPEAFANLGLIVFDECHLLHARKDDRSRRGLDAMLCLLNLTAAAPGADLLLMSAMMKNTQEIADWVKALTGRDCLALDLAWKPTRQVRGCVVYETTRLDTLNDALLQARYEKPAQKSVPAPVKRTLTAKPFGFFGLRQTWNTQDRQDYALRALLDDAQPLGTSSGSKWYLTPNGNQVSAAVAAGSVAAGMKTLVFVQTTVACGSCVDGFAARVTPRDVILTDEEDTWRALAVEEMGGSQHCYLRVDDDGVLRAGAAVHHSLLLRDERELHESLFKRRDGVDALFATSTLAQGMNLPSEVVIICGDSRFDPKADKLQQLEAHELLNAAGRAGRAGDGAQGFVLLVPSHVIAFDDASGRISGDWMDLRAIFEQSDQCLVIDDPLEATLDEIHAGTTQSGAGAYLLGRLPLAPAPGAPDPAGTLLQRSFAAYRRRLAGDDAWIASRVATALSARPAALPEGSRWVEMVAAATGVPTPLLEEIVMLADLGILDGDAGEVMSALFDWIKLAPARLMELMRPETLEGLFGDAYKKLPTDEARALQAIAAIERALPVWMAGEPLAKVEAALRETATVTGVCEHARHFALRVTPDLAFVGGLPARLLQSRQAARDPETPLAVRTVLAMLGSLVREGCATPEALAVRIDQGRGFSQVAARQLYDTCVGYLRAGDPMEDFEVTMQRTRTATLLSQFDDLA